MTQIQEALYSPFFNLAPITTPAVTELLATPGAGFKYYVTDLSITNAHATVGTVVQLRSGASTVIDQYYVGPGKDRDIGYAVPIGTGSGDALNAVCLTTGATVYISGKGFKARGTGAATGQAPAVPAYDPAGFFTGGSKLLWLNPSDNTKVLNGSDVAAADGDGAKTVTDAWGSGRTIVQTTAGSRAVYKKNAVNTSLSALEHAQDYVAGYSATGYADDLRAATSATLLLVHSLLDTTQNCNVTYVTNPTAQRLYAGMVGAQWSMNYNLADGADEGRTIYSGGSALLDLGLAAYTATIYEWNFSAGTQTVYANNATKKTTTAGTTGTIANAAATDQSVLRFYRGRILDYAMFKNALMTTQQRADWFAAVKTRFALTGY